MGHSFKIKYSSPMMKTNLLLVSALLGGCAATTSKTVADYTNAPCSVIEDRYVQTTQSLRYHAKSGWEKLQKPAPMITTSGEDMATRWTHQFTREAIEERAAVLRQTKRCKTPLMELQEETLSVLKPLPYWIEQK